MVSCLTTYNAYMLAKRACVVNSAFWSLSILQSFKSALLISKCLIKPHFDFNGLSFLCHQEGLGVNIAEHRWLWVLSDS